MRIVTLALGLAAAGCASLPGRVTQQDVDFLRGCWVAKDEDSVTHFLRLLPSGPNRKELSGYVHAVRDGGMTPVAHITLTRDGSHAVVEMAGKTYALTGDPWANARDPDGVSRANWATDGAPGGMTASAKDEVLVMAILTEKGGPLFNGERDGCD